MPIIKNKVILVKKKLTKDVPWKSQEADRQNVTIYILCVNFAGTQEKNPDTSFFYSVFSKNRSEVGELMFAKDKGSLKDMAKMGKVHYEKELKTCISLLRQRQKGSSRSPVYPRGFLQFSVCVCVVCVF